jgi:integrase
LVAALRALHQEMEAHTSLPTYFSAAQVQKVLDGCDRATAMGRRDYAILMMLAKLGMRADEVTTLTLDDFDWKAGEMLIRPPRAGSESRSLQTSPNANLV